MGSDDAVPGRRFAGRTAIVTGYTRGVGAAIARRLTAEGANLVLVACGRSELDLPGNPALVAGSVADPATAASAVEAAMNRFGRVDVLVNDAGIDYTSNLLEAVGGRRSPGLRHQLLRRPVHARAAARAMGRGGAIVNVTSRRCLSTAATRRREVTDLAIDSSTGLLERQAHDVVRFAMGRPMREAIPAPCSPSPSGQ